MKLTNICGISNAVHCVLTIGLRVLRHLNRTLPKMLPVGSSEIVPSVHLMHSVGNLLRFEHLHILPKPLRQSRNVDVLITWQ